VPASFLAAHSAPAVEIVGRVFAGVLPTSISFLLILALALGSGANFLQRLATR